jgi:hypothetical protein
MEFASTVIAGERPSRPRAPDICDARAGEYMPQVVWDVVQACWTSDASKRLDAATLQSSLQSIGIPPGKNLANLASALPKV